MNYKPLAFDPELIDLMNKYLHFIQKSVDELLAGYEQKNDVVMRSICHKILGTADSYGFEQLARIIETIQDNLKPVSWQNIEGKVFELREYMGCMVKDPQVLRFL